MQGRGRIGDVLIIDDDEREQWFDVLVGVARRNQRNVRVAIWTVQEWATDDTRIGFDRYAGLLRAIEGDGLPAMVGLYTGPKDRTAIARTDDGYISLLEFVRIHNEKIGPIPTPIALSIASQFARTLSSIPEQMCQHINANPEKWHLTADGGVVVEVEERPSWRRYDVGAAAGVLKFDASCMSPAEVSGRRTGPADVVYWIGVALHRLLSGRPLFTGNTIEVLKQIHDQHRAPIELSRALPTGLVDMIDRCVARDAEQRIYSVNTLAQHLEGFRTGPLRAPLVDVANAIRAIDPERHRGRRAEDQVIRGLDLNAALAAVAPLPYVDREVVDWAPVRDEPDATSPQHPAVRVDDDDRALFVVDDGFVIDARCVTAAEYARFVLDTFRPAPSSWPGRMPSAAQSDQPVVDVSQEDARAYCAWSGRRLPTSAEWARAVETVGADHLDTGRVWEWTSDAFDEGHVVCGGRYRDHPNVPAEPDNRSFERAGASDVGFRGVLTRRLDG